MPTGTITTERVGRELLRNNTFQYKLFKKFWPELEVNDIHYYHGEHESNTVTYLTPGLVLGTFHLWHRLGLTVSGGYEIAVTSVHPTNHISIFAVRFAF